MIVERMNIIIYYMKIFLVHDIRYGSPHQ